MTVTGNRSIGSHRQEVPGIVATTDRPRRSARFRRPVLAGAFLLAGFAVSGGAVDAEPTGFPSPLEGPGRPNLERSELKAFNKAESLYRKGRTQKALKKLANAGSGPAQQLLSLQITYARTDSQTLQGLRDLTQATPGYAAAWATLFRVAEETADERLAYEAAGRVVELWPGSEWALEAEEMRRRWLNELRAAAGHSLETQPPEEALAAVERALELDPTNHALLLGRAECLIRLDRLAEADAVLSEIGDDPSALMMAGHIAELEGDLTTAMDRYQAAPHGTPGRDEALRRVKTRWRLSVVPSYVHGALASNQVSREELAVLLVNLVPEVRAMGSGSVPLLTDILDLPSQRDIVTAARLELLSFDRVEHRFEPDRIASMSEIRSALARLAGLVGAPPPARCEVANMVSSCLELTAPVTGKEVTDAVLSLVHGERP